MIKRICLITPGHLATNPRLVKEVDALLQADYNVHVVFTQYMDYLLADDELILAKYPKLTYNKLAWTKSHRLLRILTGLTQKASIRLSSFLPNHNIFNKIILNRNYNYQLKQAVAIKADLYIAHNAGSIAVAADAAKKNQSKFAFDAEDFHRGEDLSLIAKKCIIKLEDKYLPNAFYITAASPLITKEYNKLYKKEVITILNVFPKHTMVSIETDAQLLKLFWFSQTIGLNRGIEDIIKAIGILRNKSIQLHLLGAYAENIKDQLYNMATDNGLNDEQLIFHAPISPNEVLDFASHFDIGLATETGIPYNRDICLTNKIFTYVQSGLAVIASDTQAQKELLDKFPSIGNIYIKNDPSQLAILLNSYLQNPSLLFKTKQNCFELGQTVFNWEIEKETFLKLFK